MMTDTITRYQEEVKEKDSVRFNQAEKEKSSVNIIRELMVNPQFTEERTTVFTKSTKKNSNSGYCLY